MKRWLVALAALLTGGAVSTALLIVSDTSHDGVEAYAATRDLPAGASLSTDAIQLKRVSVAGGAGLLFTRGQEPQLTALHAVHDLAAGQLIQRSDVMGSASFADRRSVFLPISDVPPIPTGGKVDLMVIGGAADHLTVAPFALGVQVETTVSGGLIVAVPARAAAAFVFAATTMHLVAIVAAPGAADGIEFPVSSPDEALAVASGR